MLAGLFILGGKKMTDNEFLKHFEQGTLDEFHHRDHIRMACIYLRKFGYEIGSAKIVEGIRQFAAAKNQNQLYHETITRFWIHLVQHALEVTAANTEFHSLLTQIPCLGDAKSIYHHYSRDFLMSDRARQQNCEPDLLPLPLLSTLTP
jgi:hypothetical protein